jgi:hypothetical protein
MAAEHEAHPTSWTEEYTEYSVSTVTLADVLEDHPLPQVHVFKVDVEGAEYDALAGADWERFRPDLVCIETEHIRMDWYPILQAAGYEQVFHDGLNGYLLSAEARHRAAYFDYAGTVLNGPTIVTPVEAAELEAAAQLRIDLATMQHEAATARLEAQAEKDALRATIAERDAAVAQLAATVAERDATVAELDATASDLTSALGAESELREMYAARHAEVAASLATTETYLTEILGSTSWRITYPLRRSIEILRARLPRRLLVRLWRRFRMPPQSVSTASVGGQEPLMSSDGADVLARMREFE